MSKQTTIAAIASVVATMGLFALTPPAFAAAPAAQDNTIEVRHADLNLATKEGQAELGRRIDNAARKVCGMGEAQTGTRIPSRSRVACYENAKRQIEPQFARLIDSSKRGA